MAAIPVVITTVYACMGIYNGVKTCSSMYSDMKKVKSYVKDKISHNMEEKLTKTIEESMDTFVLMKEDDQQEEQVVVIGGFTML